MTTATAYRLTPYQRKVLLELATRRAFIITHPSPPGAWMYGDARGLGGNTGRLRLATLDALIRAGWVELETAPWAADGEIYRLSDAGAEALR